MDLDSILSNRYRIKQVLDREQIDAIALSLYLAENLEMPIVPKPLCAIYCWQVLQEDIQEDSCAPAAIAKRLYEIGQNYTLAPKVQAFFDEDGYYCLVREYLEGYAYIAEFRTEYLDIRDIRNRANDDERREKPQTDSEVSTLKVLMIAQSLAQSLTRVPLNRRQLLVNASAAIAGFSLALFLENLKPKPKPIVTVISAPIIEPPIDPIKRGDKAFRDDLGNGIYMEMVRIPAGKFTIGSPTNEKDRRENESPLIEVKVPSFYMAKFAVTQEQWLAIVGSNVATFRDNLQAPMESISWLEAQEFCRRLATKTQHLYRLPSESEWEYACRAGTNTAYHFGDDSTQLSDYAWFAANADKRSHPIGQKVPNPWGLYEMHGGVWEWCEDTWHDTWHDNFYGAPADGKAWIEGNVGRRVRKGGSWSNEAKLCRSASREWHWQGDRYNDIGFRVVISAM